MSSLLSYDEFRDDENNQLGKANGNVYQRRPGVEGVHDGQIMVRLKKKRFIILDYSFVPTQDDIIAATSCPNVTIPDNAGKAICTTQECNKIGYPVCLYDSEPGETTSLYLRSGLCFTCQRNLNEKRRTDRKRPSKAQQQQQQQLQQQQQQQALAMAQGAPGQFHNQHVLDGGGGGGGGVNVDGILDGELLGTGSCPRPSLIYALGPKMKRFKVNGEYVELANDAIIINGAVEGTKHHHDGYNFQEIGADLQQLAQQAASEVNRLVSAVSSHTTTTATTTAMNASASASAPTSAPTVGETVVAAAVAAPAPATTIGGGGGGETVSTGTIGLGESPDAMAQVSSDTSATPMVVETGADGATFGVGEVGPTATATATSSSSTSEDINTLYDRAFQSMNKSIFLLSQWKTSWDAAIVAATAAQESVVTDPSLADAVASAAAVVAAAATTTATTTATAPTTTTTIAPPTTETTAATGAVDGSVAMDMGVVGVSVDGCNSDGINGGGDAVVDVVDVGVVGGHPTAAVDPNNIATAQEQSSSSTSMVSLLLAADKRKEVADLDGLERVAL